jgi:hypothetical protein
LLWVEEAWFVSVEDQELRTTVEVEVEDQKTKVEDSEQLDFGEIGKCRLPLIMLYLFIKFTFTFIACVQYCKT